MSQGCYPGCFYYTDSCFRKDCKKSGQQPQPTPPQSAQPAPMPLFPTMGSLQEVFDYADSKRPISCRNELYTLLMTYHNTLLHVSRRP